MRDERGETLVEVLVALSILGVAAVAILAGLQLSAKASDINRKQTSGGAYVRGYAEAIEKYLTTSSNYVRCATTGSYAPGVVGFTAAADKNYVAEVERVEMLDGGGALVGTAKACPARDEGVQRLRLKVTSPGAGTGATEYLTLVVRRACGEGAGASC